MTTRKPVDLAQEVEIYRSEEIQALIDKMPTKFGYISTVLVGGLVLTFFFFGFLIRYPDIVSGETIISSNSSPIKLIANSSGKMILKSFNSKDEVREGDYIASIQNSARVEDVQLVVEKLAEYYKKNNDKFSDMQYSIATLEEFPRNVSIGPLNAKYFIFLNAAESYKNFHQENLYDKQTEILTKLLLEKRKVIQIAQRRLSLSIKNLKLIGKFLNRDSILFSKKVITESENDRSQMNYISFEDAKENIEKEITVTEAEILDIENKIKENDIQKFDYEKSVSLSLSSALTDLQGSIQEWEQKFVFKSPIAGKVQFLKFWVNNQFIETGEAVFAVVPKENKIAGQMTLPASGAGKVKVGQEVILKLENYPYLEYGSVVGKISSISLTTKLATNALGTTENYLVDITLPNGLKTNYGVILPFKHEIRGTGEVVTSDRKLIERLFDNLRYAGKK